MVSKSVLCSSSRSENVSVASILSSGGGSRSAFAVAPSLRLERIGDAVGWRRLLGSLRAAVHAGQQQAHHPLQQLRVAPEHMEGLVEHLELLAAV